MNCTGHRASEGLKERKNKTEHSLCTYNLEYNKRPKRIVVQNLFIYQLSQRGRFEISVPLPPRIIPTYLAMKCVFFLHEYHFLFFGGGRLQFLWFVLDGFLEFAGLQSRTGRILVPTTLETDSNC